MFAAQCIESTCCCGRYGGTDQDREAFLTRRQRNRPADLRPGTLGRIDDFLRRDIDQLVIEGLQTDTNPLILHQRYSNLWQASLARTACTFYSCLFIAAYLWLLIYGCLFMAAYL